MHKHTVVLLPALTLFAVLAARPSTAQEPSFFSESQTLGANLEKVQTSGKPATLMLKNGQSVSGKLAAVGEHAVIVTEISGREFSDSLVVLEEIAAVEVRVRSK
jgi:hypothetical protein